MAESVADSPDEGAHEGVTVPLTPPDPPFQTRLFRCAAPEPSAGPGADVPGQPFPWEHFPISFRTEDGISVVDDDNLGGFLAAEFSLKRLEWFGRSLLLVGQQQSLQTLTHHDKMGRKIALTDDLDMHLVCDKKTVYIKPLPRYLLEPEFWTRDGFRPVPPKKRFRKPGRLWPHGAPISIGDRAAAFGLLYSYACLINNPVDLKLALNHDLLPLNDQSPPEWAKWRAFAAEILRPGIITQVHWRFGLGELSLTGLNRIERLTNFWTGPMAEYDGYHSSGRDVDDGMISLITTAIVILGLPLTAMQVGLGTNALKENTTFNDVSFVFSVIVLFLVALLGYTMLFYMQVRHISRLLSKLWTIITLEPPKARPMLTSPEAHPEDPDP